jgi:hypothetical protein
VFSILLSSIQYLDLETVINISHSSKKFQSYKQVKKVLNQTLKNLVLEGLNTLDRARFWNYKTRYIYYKLRYKGLYGKILEDKESDYSQDIQKDLERTYPHLPYF